MVVRYPEGSRLTDKPESRLNSVRSKSSAPRSSTVLSTDLPTIVFFTGARFLLSSLSFELSERAAAAAPIISAAVSVRVHGRQWKSPYPTLPLRVPRFLLATNPPFFCLVAKPFPGKLPRHRCATTTRKRTPFLANSIVSRSPIAFDPTAKKDTNEPIKIAFTLSRSKSLDTSKSRGRPRSVYSRFG